MDIDPTWVARQRALIRHLLADAMQEAARTGKPLMIIAGENHNDPVSLLNNLLLLQETQALGITDVGLEERSVRYFVNGLHNAQDMHDFQSEILNLSPLLLPKRTYHPIDKGRAVVDEQGHATFNLDGEKVPDPNTDYENWMRFRENKMNDALDTLPDSMLVLVGNAHAKAIYEHFRDRRTMLVLNTPPLNPEGLEQDIQRRPSSAGRYRFVYDRSIVYPLGEHAPADLNRATSIDSIRAAFGPNADTVLREARQRGVVFDGDTPALPYEDNSAVLPPPPRNADDNPSLRSPDKRR